MRARLSVRRQLRRRPRGGPRAADGAPRRAAAGARGVRGAHDAGARGRGVRRRTTAARVGTPSTARRLESARIRDGNARRYRAGGWWRTEKVREGWGRCITEQPPPTSPDLPNLPRPAFSRLCNGGPPLPRARRPDPHAPGERLRGTRSPGTG